MDIDKTLTDRKVSYGSMENNANITRSFMGIIESSDNYDKLTDMHIECFHMILHKISRCLNGDVNNVDTIHDIVGYSKLLENYLSGDKPKGKVITEVVFNTKTAKTNIVLDIISNFSASSCIINGILTEVWKNPNKSYKLTDYRADIIKEWINLGLLEGDIYSMELTDKGKEVVANKNLISYEYIISNELSKSSNVVTKAENYSILRLGLTEYYKTYLRESFMSVFHSIHDSKSLIDIGAGDCIYSRDIFDKIEVTILDRKLYHNEDVPWKDDHIEFKRTYECDIFDFFNISMDTKYDVYMMIELLHCLNNDEIKILSDITIKNSPKYILIGEQLQNTRLSIRFKRLADGDTISSKYIEEMFSKYKTIRYVEAYNHYFMLMERI